MKEDMAVLSFVLSGGLFLFSLFIIYVCYVISKRRKNKQLQDLHLIEQQQQQQQQQQHLQQSAVENSAVLSIYPIKPELDPPPSYESVISP